MNFRTYSAVFTFLAFCCGQAMACSCTSKGDFIQYANQSEGVIRAKIAGYGDPLTHGESLYESMIVEVIDVIRGGLEFESIVLLGDPGNLCRDYVDSNKFIIGKEYFIALHGNESTQPFGGCGEAWLSINDGVAEGQTWEMGELRKYTVPISILLESVKSK